MSKKSPNSNQGILDSLELFRWIVTELPNKRFLGDKALRTKCTSFKEEEFGSKKMRRLAELLVSSLKKYRAKTGMGRGLSANEMGVAWRMIVVWLGDEPEVMVNPEIVKLEGKGSYWECCISSGTVLIGEVIRPWKGTFRYRDIEGRKNILEADEKQTRIFLHEIDHLNGITCIEKYKPGTIRFVRGGKEEIFSYKLKRLE